MPLLIQEEHPVRKHGVRDVECAGNLDVPVGHLLTPAICFKAPSFCSIFVFEGINRELNLLGLPGMILVHASCPSKSINSIFFDSSKCLAWKDKLHGHPSL